MDQLTLTLLVVGTIVMYKGEIIGKIWEHMLLDDASAAELVGQELVGLELGVSSGSGMNS